MKGEDILKKGGFTANPVCKGVQDWQKAGISLDLEDYQIGQAKPPTDVKENLILSTACLCIPGTLYNINKMRQIRCQYAYCLGKRVLEEGLPKSYCDDEKAYLTCNYVTGQIFDLIPFTWLANQISSMVQDFYANPISIVAAVAGCLCGGCKGLLPIAIDYCAPDKGKATGFNAAMYVTCSVFKTAAKLGDAIQAIKTMQGKGSDYFKVKPSKDWCKEAEELAE